MAAEPSHSKVVDTPGSMEALQQVKAAETEAGAKQASLKEWSERELSAAREAADAAVVAARQAAEQQAEAALESARAKAAQEAQAIAAEGERQAAAVTKGPASGVPIDDRVVTAVLGEFRQRARPTGQ